MAIIGILAGILLPALMSAREQTRRKSCVNNLAQIGKACISYQEPNGDYFPAFMQQATNYPTTPATDTLNGRPWIISPSNGGPWWSSNGSPGGMVTDTAGQSPDGAFQPMPSLASLYPTYCPDVKVFACPSTNDTPQIAWQYFGSALHTCFGFVSYNAAGVLINTVDPAAYTGNEISTSNKCSYLYDELAQPRDLSPDQAMAADADGQTWFLPGGQTPAYPPNWWRIEGVQSYQSLGKGNPPKAVATAQPPRPNHNNGQNVMYLDGHVKWTDAVYSSHDPADNIFCPNSTGGVQWNPDIDSYLWDGVDSRTVQTP